MVEMLKTIVYEKDRMAFKDEINCIFHLYMFLIECTDFMLY